MAGIRADHQARLHALDRELNQEQGGETRFVFTVTALVHVSSRLGFAIAVVRYAQKPAAKRKE
ncbi:MAG: hypothetical protein JKY66_05975 [Spongiibacteraceae bacterium]|nr:hypothetical protein [Spongiibacteraceae bacterium]